MRTSIRTIAFLAPLVVACAASSPAPAPGPAPVAPADMPVAAQSLAGKRVARSAFAAALRQPWVDAASRAAMEQASAPQPQAPGRELLRGTSYPAFKPFAPQITTGGNATLKAPKVITVTWDGDPNRDAYETFGDQLGGTPYWKTINGEYGVGPITGGASHRIHIAGAPPATIESAAVKQMLTTNLQNAVTTGWPVDTDGAIYTVYMPQSTKVTEQGQPACQMYGGYHDELPLTISDVSRTASWAIILNCPGSAVDYVTEIATHELNEAATDPFPFTKPAYYGFDTGHLAYNVFQSQQSEVGDACEFFAESWYEEAPPFTFAVQRQWSNASVAAGHNPCVPAIGGEAYYNVTTFPEQMDDVTIDLSKAGIPAQKTKGFKVPLGTSRTFDLGFYSDAPTGAWTVNVISVPTLPVADYSTGTPVANGVVQVSIDQPTGKNGHKAKVTVTPLTAGAFGGQYIELVSGGADWQEAHVLPLFIGQN